MADLRVALRAGLTDAMKSRNALATSVLRSAIAAIDNAEAADPAAAPAQQAGRIAGGVHGLGAGEVPRQTLYEHERLAILAYEIEQRRVAAAEYARAGHDDRAARLNAEADVLEGYLH